MTKVELTRFEVKDGLTRTVDEWLKFLNEHMSGTLLTLNSEKMYVETILSKKTAAGEFLYWFSIQGEGGQAVEESDSWIDKQHLKYWYACIDESVPSEEITPRVMMIPDRIRKLMK